MNRVEFPNVALIHRASAVLKPTFVGNRLLADVGAALITRSGAVHRGVCIDTGSGTGFCVEHAAIDSMVTSGEYQIARIAAVWRDDSGRLYVLPPCGRCREFIRQIHPDNINTEVVLDRSLTMMLSELLPKWEWPSPLASP